MALSFNPSGAAAPDPVEGEGGPPQAAEVQDAGKPLQRESLPFLIRVAQACAHAGQGRSDTVCSVQPACA